MQFWKKLNNRSRILLLLMISLILLNTIVLVTTYNLKNLSESFQSILNDRLIPSAEITGLQGFSYKNRLYLEDMVFGRTTASLRNEMEQNNRKIDSTFAAFKLTYFTKEESEHARQYVNVLAQYRQQEQQILESLTSGDGQQAKEQFYTSSQKVFLQMMEELHQLSNIQLVVGKSLHASTSKRILLIKAVAYCSLCISLVVAAHLLVVLGIKPSLVPKKYHG